MVGGGEELDVDVSLQHLRERLLLTCGGLLPEDRGCVVDAEGPTDRLAANLFDEDQASVTPWFGLTEEVVGPKWLHRKQPLQQLLELLRIHLVARRNRDHHMREKPDLPVGLLRTNDNSRICLEMSHDL